MQKKEDDDAHPDAPQCRPHSNIKGGKLRCQFIADNHVTTQEGGVVPMGMCPPEIDSYSFDINIPPDDHRGTPVELVFLL